MRFLCQNDFGITKSLDPTATLSVHLHSRTLVPLIPVMLRFVWPFNRNTDIICLFSGKLGEFGVPSSVHFDVFPVESFIQFSAFYNFNAATAAAIPLGLLTLMILIIERLFLRIVKRGLTGAWLVGFIFCLRDLDITMIVYPPAHDTLPVRIFTLMANSPEEVIAALSMIMVAITLLPLGTLALITKYRG